MKSLGELAQAIRRPAQMLAQLSRMAGDKRRHTYIVAMWHKESRGGEGRVGTTEGKYFRVKREDARPPADRMIYKQTSLQKEGPEESTP